MSTMAWHLNERRKDFDYSWEWAVSTKKLDKSQRPKEYQGHRLKFIEDEINSLEGFLGIKTKTIRVLDENSIDKHINYFIKYLKSLKKSPNKKEYFNEMLKQGFLSLPGTLNYRRAHSKEQVTAAEIFLSELKEKRDQVKFSPKTEKKLHPNHEEYLKKEYRKANATQRGVFQRYEKALLTPHEKAGLTTVKNFLKTVDKN